MLSVSGSALQKITSKLKCKKVKPPPYFQNMVKEVLLMLVWPGMNCSHAQKRLRTCATEIHTILTRTQAMLL